MGVDYAWHGALNPARWKADGYSFVCRYLSHTPSKDIGLAEAQQVSAAGLDIVLVWETTANRAGQGYAAGKADALSADARARALGMPNSRPLYFAVDFDARLDQVAYYFQGLRAILPIARIGAYGGRAIIKGLFDSGAIAWGWQTSAWSYHKWEPRAHLQQYAYDYSGGGLYQADKNRAMFDDFGQWRLGQPAPAPQPQEDSDMTAEQFAAHMGELQKQTALLQELRYVIGTGDSYRTAMHNALLAALITDDVAPVVKENNEAWDRGIVTGLPMGWAGNKP